MNFCIKSILTFGSCLKNITKKGHNCEFSFNCYTKCKLTCLDEERTCQKSRKLTDEEWCDFCMGDFDNKTRPAKTHEFVKYLSTGILVADFMKIECQNTPSKFFG